LKLSINQEYSDLIPPLSETEFFSLKESIKQDGLWLPIIVNVDGVILDGHHRYKACQELNIQIKHAVREFPTKTEEILFVGESNLKRRQLEPLQRIAVVKKLKPYYEEKARVKQSEGGKSKVVQTFAEPINVRDILSEKANVSHTQFSKGEKILDNVPIEVQNTINSGQKTINKVFKEIVKNEKREARQEEIKKIQVNLPDSITLHNSEFQKAYIPGNSVSLIFTDPPYHEKYLHLYEDLAVHASRVLREGGSLICYVGH